MELNCKFINYRELLVYSLTVKITVLKSSLNLGADQTRRLEIKERPDIGVYVKDKKEFAVNSVEDMERIMTSGNKNRQTATTKMNADSFRSHAIFTVTIETRDTGPGTVFKKIYTGNFEGKFLDRSFLVPFPQNDPDSSKFCRFEKRRCFSLPPSLVIFWLFLFKKINTIFKTTIKDGKQRKRAGHLHLVDLAGSERQVKTGEHFLITFDNK